MTLFDVFERLRAIDQAVSSLLRDNGFQSGKGLGARICTLPDEAQDTFRQGQAEELLELLEPLHEMLHYLEQPLHGEHTLEPFKSGRYGYFDKNGDAHIFTCGDPLEARIHDPCGQQRWVRTRIEHNGSDYFLWGYPGVVLSGLTVRERGDGA